MTGADADRDGSDGDDRRGRIRVAAGVVLFAAGITALLAPGAVLDRVPGALVAVGVLALAAGVRAARRADRPTPFRTPDVESLPRVPVPGETVDRTLAPFLDEGEAHLLYPRRVRAALSNAAVAVLARYRGLAPSTARERVEAGDWTDDRVAAGFLAGEDPPGSGRGIPGLDRAPGGPRLPGIDRLRGGESAFDRGIRHAVAAVAAVAGVDVGSPSFPTTGGSGDGDRDGGGRVRVGPDPAGRTPAGEGDPTDATSEGDSTGAVSDGGRDPDGRRTRRWAGLGAVTFLAAGAGVVAGWPGAVLASAVLLGYAAAAGALDAPDPVISVDREPSATDPDPGDRVEVTVTVTNEGERTLPDLRVVDGVPPGLPVVEGSPRWAGPLRPGRSVTLEYALVARRGRHEFDPLLAVARDPLGARERVVRVAGEDPDGREGDPGQVDDGPEGGITCVPPLTPVAGLSLRRAADRYAGEVPTGEGGDGVEFHATREYRRGDPLTRVDWNRLARHGDLASREYRVERATTVAVVVDARRAAYLAPDPGRPHAVDRSVAAARSILAALDGSGNRVGVAALGDGSRECWLAPSTGADHRARARHLLATHPALSSVPPRVRDGNEGGSSSPAGRSAPANEGSAAASGTAVDGGRTPGASEASGIGRPGRTEADGDLTDAERRAFRRLRARIPAGAQVVFCSPVADAGAVRVARDLSARGHPVTVVAPDPTAADAPTRVLGRVGRTLRLAQLRDGGPTVVDWPADVPLAVALARSGR